MTECIWVCNYIAICGHKMLRDFMEVFVLFSHIAVSFGPSLSLSLYPSFLFIWSMSCCLFYYFFFAVIPHFLYFHSNAYKIFTLAVKVLESNFLELYFCFVFWWFHFLSSFSSWDYLALVFFPFFSFALRWWLVHTLQKVLFHHIFFFL